MKRILFHKLIETKNKTSNWLRRLSIGSLLNNKIFWLFMIAVLAQGFILLMDGLYHDDIMLYDLLNSGKIDVLFSYFNEMGSMLNATAFFHWGIYLVFGKNLIFGYRLLAFVFLFLIGVLVYAILSKLKDFNKADAFYVAAIVISYPASKVVFLGITLPGLFCLCLFFLACYITLAANDGGGGQRKSRGILQRIVSLLLFFVSFQINSLLVFYYGFLLLIFLLQAQASGIIKRVIDFALKKADYIILPFIYYAIKIIYFPSKGVNLEYNRLIFDAPSGILKIITDIIHGIYYSLIPLFTLLHETAFIVILLVCVFFIFWETGRQAIGQKGLSRNHLIFLFGFFLLFLAISPYAAVGKRPTVGFESRHLLLIGLPVGLLVVSFVNLIFSYLSLPDKYKKLIYLIIISIFALDNIGNYSAYQIRAIKDRALMLQLSEMPSAKAYSTFLIRNWAYNADERSYYDNGVYEWSRILKMTWGEERWLGGAEEEYKSWKSAVLDKRKWLNPPMTMPNYNPHGPKALMVVTRTNDFESGGSFWQLKRFKKMILYYYYYKYFKPKELNNYLKKIISVKVVRL